MKLTSVPSLTEAVRFGDPIVAGTDVIEGSLFDYQIYPAAGLTFLNFFSQGIGQGLSSSPGFAGNVKTPQDTNMQLNGQLPQGYNFLVQAVELDFEPGLSAAANTFVPMAPQSFTVAAVGTVQNGVHDVNVLRVSGGLTMTVQSKEFVNDAPLGLFPPMNRLDLSASVATNSAAVGELLVASARFAGRAYSLSIPRLISSNQSFGVKLTFPAAVATPSGFNGRIGVRLRGLMYRPVQ